jgi:FeS assembly SUF system regulator
MLRMSKLTDYGLVLLTHMAQEGAPAIRTAHELAERSRVPLPTVSKILKELSKAGIVVSHRGRRGGYSLARPPEQISVAAVVEALEGPVALTECSSALGACSLEPVCPAKGHWGPISRAIQRTLQRLPLSALGPRPVRVVRPPPVESTPTLREMIP